MFFTTHSPIETFKSCPMKRYLEYHHLGTGIRPKSKSIPLTTGAEIHTGVTYLLDIVKQLQQTNTPEARLLLNSRTLPDQEIDHAVSLALTNYVVSVGNAGYLQPNQLPQQEQFTFNEQQTLIEALIRVWAKVELPIIMEHYTVLDVENEIPYPLSDDIILGSRADALLQRKNGKEITVYSLKTIKRWDAKRERSYRKDTQCVTETEAVKWWLTKRAEYAETVANAINLQQEYYGKDGVSIPNMDMIYLWLQQFRTIPQTIGVQFCFLIKGERREGKVDNGYQSQTESNSPGLDTWHSNRSPLLSCFVKFTPGGVELAHTNKVVKPENKSGYGLLGKGWEEQYVWECEALGSPTERVKNWVTMLPTLQPGLEERLGRILDKSVVRPIEVFVSPDRCKTTLRSISIQETNIANALDFMDQHHMLEDWFPKNEHSCHWPEHCEFNPICWNEEIYSSSPFHVSLESVLESGFYERRESHYKLESTYRETERTGASNDGRNTVNADIFTGDVERTTEQDSESGRDGTRASNCNEGYDESISNPPEGCTVESDKAREALERE